MALGTNHVTLTEATASSRTRSNSAFIRELWSDEIIANYKKNLVLQPLVVKMNHNGQKGDTIHVPRPTRGSPSAKAAETQVTLIAAQENTKQFLIDQHWEYSRLIEDIVRIQADDTLRAFYTDDAGYALAKKTDSDLHALGTYLNGMGFGASGDKTANAADYAAGAADGTGANWNGITTGAALTDAGIRTMIQNLDDSDVPNAGRVLVIPPVEKKNLMGLARFTEEAFVGEVGTANTIRNGYVGNIYGIEVYVSSNCADTINSVSGTRAALLFQKEAFLHISQLAPRTQTQYKLEWLGDLFTSDMIYGTGVLRPEAGISIVVPA